jgi:hypothetical protein
VSCCNVLPRSSLGEAEELLSVMRVGVAVHSRNGSLSTAVLNSKQAASLFTVYVPSLICRVTSV